MISLTASKFPLDSAFEIAICLDEAADTPLLALINLLAADKSPEDSACAIEV